MTSSPSSKSGFTLVELIAVIAIMAIMVAASLPALRALQGTALQTAARQVQSDMMLARQHAITQRLPVRFAICVTTNGVLDLGTNHVCRAYSIVIATNDANNVLVGWRPVQDWKFLPTGVVFSDQNDTYYNTINLDPVPPLGIATNRNLGVAGSSADSWRHFSTTNTMDVYLTSTPTTWIAATVEFRPTGRVTGISSAGSVRLINGTLINPLTRQLIVTDTNNWINIEYDLFGRVRQRPRESYQ
jgi:prepilin-type N-terminal cleavage/methylation domain-containing protein